MALDIEDGINFPKCGQVSGLLPQAVEKKEVLYLISLCPWAVEGA